MCAAEQTQIIRNQIMENKQINCYHFIFDVRFRCLPAGRGNIHFKLSSRARRVTKPFDVMVADRAISGCLSAKCKQACDFSFPPDAGSKKIKARELGGWWMLFRVLWGYLLDWWHALGTARISKAQGRDWTLIISAFHTVPLSSCVRVLAEEITKFPAVRFILSPHFRLCFQVALEICLKGSKRPQAVYILSTRRRLSAGIL